VRSTPCTMRRGARVSWLSLKTKINGLSVVWPQNHCDGLSVVWPQKQWDSFSRFSFKTGGDDFSRFSLKTGGGGFPGLGLKTGSYGLMIWALKSLRRFLGLYLKTKRATVCRLRHKTDRG
jgi:hypothetical protein